MGHHVGAPGRRLLHADADLLVGVLIHPEGIGRREHAARHHHLDLVSALAKLLPHYLSHLIDAVGHLRGDPVIAGAAAGLEAGLVAHVAVAAGLAYGPAGEQHPGARDQALLHGEREPQVGAPRIAHRGEAPPERAFEAVPCVLMDQRRRHVVEGRHVEVDEEGVEVGVDQARHQRSPAAGHALGIRPVRAPNRRQPPRSGRPRPPRSRSRAARPRPRRTPCIPRRRSSRRHSPLARTVVYQASP